MRSIATVAAVTLSLFGVAALAHAAGKRFVTPLLGTATGEVFVCAVVNVDKKPITASVKLVNRDGGLITVGATDCDVAIAPGAGCRVSGTSVVTTGYCDATTSSAKVRVDLLVIDTGNPNHVVAAVPGTLK